MERHRTEKDDMATCSMGSRSHALGIRIAIISTAALVFSGCAAQSPSAKPGSSAAEQRFSTPKAAVDALVAACGNNDEARLLAIFGEQAKPIVSTGDPASDRERCQKFVDAAKEMTRLDPKGPDRAQLVVGSDDWPFPIPLVKDDKSWRFDTAEGLREIRRRRVGADELEAIKACRTYVIAQEEHAARTRGAYASALVGARGKAGLAWPVTGDEDASPVVASDASPKGQGPQATWRGYHYRILTSQGGNAPDGQRSYVTNGKMTRGFALVAYPAIYGLTGVKTFVVGPDGHVYEKDLGEKSDQVAAAITSYDPDGTWKRID
jgi:hypothetical protein